MILGCDSRRRFAALTTNDRVIHLITKSLERMHVEYDLHLAAIVGSRAREDNAACSDYDVVIVSGDKGVFGLHGVHWDTEGGPRIDFMWLDSDAVHQKTVDSYFRLSLLRHAHVIWSCCEVCSTYFQNSERNRPTAALCGGAEGENLVWHLLNTLHKIRQATELLELRMYLCKFLYFVPNVCGRLFDRPLTSEGRALKEMWAATPDLYRKYAQLLEASVHLRDKDWLLERCEELVAALLSESGRHVGEFCVEVKGVVTPIDYAGHEGKEFERASERLKEIAASLLDGLV